MFEDRNSDDLEEEHRLDILEVECDFFELNDVPQYCRFRDEYDQECDFDFFVDGPRHQKTKKDFADFYTMVSDSISRSLSTALPGSIRMASTSG